MPVWFVSDVFTSGEFVRLVFTHDSTESWVYIGNSHVFQYSGSVFHFSGFDNSLADIGSVLHLFRDDFDTNQRQAGSGFVDYIRIYDKALTANEVINGVSAVPEPETYAMMLAGLGLLGFAARRRKQAAAA